MPSFTGNICPRSDEGGDLGVAGNQWGSVNARARSLNKLAGAILSGHRMVTTDATGKVVYADSGTPGHSNRVLGMTTQAASLGAPVLVQIEGEHEELGWSWTPETPLYLGTNGAIVATPPASGFICRIGWAVTATKIAIQIGPAIVLA